MSITAYYARNYNTKKYFPIRFNMICPEKGVIELVCVKKSEIICKKKNKLRSKYKYSSIKKIETEAR